MISYSLAQKPDKKAEEELKDFSPLIKQLLYNRGIRSKRQAKIFLSPSYDRDINDPFLMKGMEKAVGRILQAINENEEIIIYGDYDCDGIPGSVVLHDFFKKIGYKNFDNYIPHRHSEGYGLNENAVKQFGKENIKLVITVDCGITDTPAISRAAKLGIDVIVTDHHIQNEKLPPAYVILNPKQEGDIYPDDMLCGAGVAWKLVQALVRKVREKNLFEIEEGWEKMVLDMAGLATIADMVPLRDENRAIASFGLEMLRRRKRSGLQKLLRKARVKQAYLTEGDLAFMVAPRINAASRMDEPMAAFRLLATDDEDEAEELATHLQEINNDRKLTVARITKEIKHTLLKRELREVIVIGNPKWRVGVLGIAATNVMEEYGKPTFVWGREGEHIKGSVRANGDVNVVELMGSVSKGVFVDVGGHESSGGFTTTTEKVHLLEEELVQAYHKVKKAYEEVPLVVDAELTLSQVNWDTWEKIEKLAPFGVGNLEPTFLLQNVVLEKIRMFGKGREHLEVRIGDSKKSVSAIGFFMSSDDFDVELIEGMRIHMLAHMEKSTYRSIPELRLRIVHIERAG